MPGGVELEQYLGRAEYNAFRKMSLTGIFHSAFPCAPSTRLHMVGFTFQGAGAARTIVIERHGSRARSSVGSKKRTMIPPPVGTYEWRHCVLREAIREERTVRVLFQTTGVPGLHMFRTWHERVARIDDIERLRRIPRDTVLPEGLPVDFVPMKKFPVRLFLETIYPYCKRMEIVGAAESDVPMCS